MARGWESKSAVVRAEQAEVRPTHNAPDPAALDLIRKREGIQLSRARIVSELKSAQNPRYRDLLNRTLADLDARLSSLSAD